MSARSSLRTRELAMFSNFVVRFPRSRTGGRRLNASVSVDCVDARSFEDERVSRESMDNDVISIDQGMVFGNSGRQEGTSALSRLAICGPLDAAALDLTGSPAPFDIAMRLLSVLDQRGLSALRRIDAPVAYAYITPALDELVVFRSLTCPTAVYFYSNDSGVVVTTDPRSITGPVPPSSALDWDVLPAIVANVPIPPDRCVLAGVKRLAGGHSLTVRLDRELAVREEDTFGRRFNRGTTLDEASEGLRSRASAAVSRTVARYDRLNIALSGGVDSAILCYELVQQGAAVKAYQWRCDAAASLSPDAAAAELVARASGIPLTSCDISRSVAERGDYLNLYSAASVGVPLTAGGIPALEGLALTVSKDAAWSALAFGEIADSLFKSSSRPFRPAPESLDASEAVLGGKQLAALGPWYAPPARSKAAQSIVETARWYEQRLAAADIDPDRAPSAARTFIAVMKSIHSDHYPVVDAACWRPHRVLVNCPLLHRELIEYCIGLPHDLKIGYWQGAYISKWAWRFAYAGRLPIATLRRTMQPAASVIAEIFLRRNPKVIDRLFDGRSILVSAGIVSPAALEDLRRNPFRAAQQAWYLMSACATEIWLRKVCQVPLEEVA